MNALKERAYSMRDINYGHLTIEIFKPEINVWIIVYSLKKKINKNMLGNLV
jgi:hypothetical protein